MAIIANPRKFWIFKCRPKDYDLDCRLATTTLKEISWKVTRYQHEIKKGDIVFIWENGRCLLRGMFKVTDEPAVRDELDSEQPFNRPQGSGIRGCRVLGEMFDFTFGTHQMDIHWMRTEPQLAGISVLTFDPRGTNFPVRQEEAQILLARCQVTLPRSPDEDGSLMTALFNES